MKTAILPTNDLAFGAYPQRELRHASNLGISSIGLPDWLRGGRAVSPVFIECLRREQASVSRLSDADLSQRIARSGIKLRQTGVNNHQCAKALAIAGEVMSRSIGFKPYPSQMFAAHKLLRGQLVEMHTGEGKTLAVALAAAVAANAGSSVFVLTANDYLVSRDCEQLKPFFEVMGLSVGQVVNTTEPDRRKRNWREQIVYSSAKEMAFDYLRDHLHWQGNRDSLSQRVHELTRATQATVSSPSEASNETNLLIPGLCFCIVDEADSLLLDEATTPLIVADQLGTLDSEGYKKAYELAGLLQDGRDFQVNRSGRRVALTQAGVKLVETSFRDESGDLALTRRAIELVETAVSARLLFLVGRDYAVAEQKVVLIDELTGRVAEGRQWQGALHAMVQIKEGLEPTPPMRTSAQITYQDLFPRFMHLCGTSGTLRDARREFNSLYALSVSHVPLNRPSQIQDIGTRVYSTMADKWAAVIDAVIVMRSKNRPVLIGNASVKDSAQLSNLLTENGIQHQVLNATQCEKEAACLDRAGRAGVVTVATNIAGRGTDIKLSEVARRNGGLHVIATMRNRSRRIDRQLSGRAGRQGDPGSHQCMVSLEDRLISDALPASIRRLLASIFELTGGRGQRVWRSVFSISQRIEQSRDYFVRAALRSASKGRYRQFSFLGRPE